MLDHALKTLSAGYALADLKSAYDKLSLAYRSGTRITLNSHLLCLAYGQARMPATVSVLQQMASHLHPHRDRIQNLLDLGCGPGSALWAFRHDFPLKTVTCVDQSKALMQFGQELLAQFPGNFSTTWTQSRLQESQTYKTFSLQAYDLITVSYVLNELTSAEQKHMLEAAWDATQHFLVIVEPGTPKGFENIRNARSRLILAGAHILAPCTHWNACPMEEDNWCHFSSRLQRSKLHQDMKGSLPYEDEKYSYLIASKENVATPAARILKKPNQSSGLVEFEICYENGLSLKKISKRQGELYKKARKASWGDGWPGL